MNDGIGGVRRHDPLDGATTASLPGGELFDLSVPDDDDDDDDDDDVDGDDDVGTEQRNAAVAAHGVAGGPRAGPERPGMRKAACRNARRCVLTFCNPVRGYDVDPPTLLSSVRNVELDGRVVHISINSLRLSTFELCQNPSRSTQTGHKRLE